MKSLTVIVDMSVSLCNSLGLRECGGQKTEYHPQKLRINPLVAHSREGQWLKRL